MNDVFPARSFNPTLVRAIVHTTMICRWMIDERYSLDRVLSGFALWGWDSQDALLDELERRILDEDKAGMYCGA